MKRIPKMQILVWVLAIVPIILTAVFYPRLPASIPMQWDFGGQVGYEPKWHLFIIAALAPLFAILFPLIPKIDQMCIRDRVHPARLPRPHAVLGQRRVQAG